MYCRKCGARMSEQDRFCPECGTEASKGNTQQDELNGFPGNEQPQENPRMNKKTVIWIWILAAWIFSFFYRKRATCEKAISEFAGSR